MVWVARWGKTGAVCLAVRLVRRVGRAGAWGCHRGRRWHRALRSPKLTAASPPYGVRRFLPTSAPLYFACPCPSWFCLSVPLAVWNMLPSQPAPHEWPESGANNAGARPSQRTVLARVRLISPKRGRPPLARQPNAGEPAALAPRVRRRSRYSAQPAVGPPPHADVRRIPRERKARASMATARGPPSTAPSSATPSVSPSPVSCSLPG